MVDEFRQALRAVRRAPVFLAVSALLLAIGCGVTGAAFATVRGWLSFDRVIPDAEHLVVIAPTRNGTVSPTGYFRESSYRHLRQLGGFRTIEALFGTVPERVVLSTSNISLTARMEAVQWPSAWSCWLAGEP
jgi:hypothetical protein